MTTKETKLIKDIRDLAAKNYEKGGHWLMECYDDEEILKHFSSVEEAQKAWEEKEENAREYEAAREFYDDGEFWSEFYGVENY